MNFCHENAVHFRTYESSRVCVFWSICFGGSGEGGWGSGCVCGGRGAEGVGALLRGAVAYNASVIYVISLPYDGRN